MTPVIDHRNEPTEEERKRYLRRYLGLTRNTNRPGVFEGKMSFSKKSHWKKDPQELQAPLRAADVAIITYKAEGDDLKRTTTDHTSLTIQEYHYILSLLRDRIALIEQQPLSRGRLDLLEETRFAVDLICKLDV